MRQPRASILGRLARVVIAVLAAGAGWFGFERFVLDSDAVADQSSPWAAVQSTDDDWTSFVFTSSDSVGRQIVMHDGANQTTRIEFQPNDEQQPFQTVELAGATAWQRDASGAWAPVSESVLGDHTVESRYLSTPVRVTDAFPPAIHDFLTVDDDQGVGDVHRYEVSIDVSRFAEAAPIAYRRWSDSRLIRGRLNAGLPAQPDLVLKMNVRADGYIVRWYGDLGGGDLTWTDLDDAILLESPAVSAIAAATAPSSERLSDESGHATPRRFETTAIEDGDVRYVRRIDADLAVIQDETLELTATDLFQLIDGEWKNVSAVSPEISADGILTAYNGFSSQLIPPLVDELVPPDVPYVSILESERVFPGRRISFEIDQEQWAQQAPAEYGAWYEQFASLIVDDRYDAVVDQTTGRLTELGYADSNSRFTWTVLDDPLDLQSPIGVD